MDSSPPPMMDSGSAKDRHAPPTISMPARLARSAGLDILAAVRDPVVFILFLAGLFDGISDNWVHAGVLWGVATLIGIDDARRRRGIELRERPLLQGEAAGSTTGLSVARAIGIAAALLYSGMGGNFQRYTWPATFVILGPAVAVVALSWRGPLRSHPVPEPLQAPGIAAWSALFIVAGLWELGALLAQPSMRADSFAHPTISFLMDPILSHHVGRSAVLLLWLALGWWLMNRPGWEPPEETFKDELQ
jgi:hypothetical protein